MWRFSVRLLLIRSAEMTRGCCVVNSCAVLRFSLIRLPFIVAAASVVCNTGNSSASD